MNLYDILGNRVQGCTIELQWHAGLCSPGKA